MTSARLLSAFLLLGSLPVFAQDHPKTSGKQFLADSRNATTAEPWRILPENTGEADLAQDPLARLQTSQPPRYRDKQDQGLNVLTNSDHSLMQAPTPHAEISSAVDSLGRRADDTTCLTIRTYVVERDRKDSDSTHLVRYSTCQPAKQYQLRTAVGSGER
jgi:hypothetical protein